MPQNDLGLTWHEACAWWCDQEPECVSAWHRISGNHCSLYNFTLPFAANNHPTSHIYVKPTPEYIMVSDASSCESVGMVTITTVSQCAAAVNALGFAENYSQGSVPSTDYYDRKNGCIWHAGAKGATLFSGSIRMDEPCNYQGYAGCLCEKAETFTTTTMETTEFVNDECPSYCTDSWVGDNYCDHFQCFMCTHFWNGDVFDDGDCDSYPDSSMDSGDDSSMDDGCPSYCTDSWVGDDYCDLVQCFMCTHFWNGDVFDSGDCASYPDSSMDSGDDSSMDDGCPGYCIGNWVGDNICDNLQCSMCPHFWDDNVFDGGDCGQHESTTASPVESTTAESTTEPTDVVSCRFTIDNIVTMIRYNGEELETSGNRAHWGTPKVFEFIPVPGAILEIAGEEATPRDNFGCEWSGLLLECDNGFISNPVDFKAFGSNEPIVDYELSEPCVSTSPFRLNGQTSDAQKIWAANGATYAYFQAIPVGFSNAVVQFTTP